MILNKNQYFLVGARPVYTSIYRDGRFEILAYEWETGNFINTTEYLSRIFFTSMDEIEELPESDFLEKVESLREKFK